MDRFLFFIVHSPRKTTSFPWKERSIGKALGTRLFEKLTWSKRIMQAFQTSVFSRVKINTQAPSTRIRLSLNPQLFLSGYCFRPQVRWIRHTNPPETCGRANSIWIRIRVDVEIFLIRKEKVAHPKISGYVWTGPYFPVYKHTENMRLSRWVWYEESFCVSRRLLSTKLPCQTDLPHRWLSWHQLWIVCDYYHWRLTYWLQWEHD